MFSAGSFQLRAIDNQHVSVFKLDNLRYLAVSCVYLVKELLQFVTHAVIGWGLKDSVVVLQGRLCYCEIASENTSTLPSEAILYLTAITVEPSFLVFTMPVKKTAPP